ncbi:MAG: hypothetical protein AB7N54_14265 [Alphaproteobacteria bacterium]
MRSLWRNLAALAGWNVRRPAVADVESPLPAPRKRKRGARRRIIGAVQAHLTTLGFETHDATTSWRPSSTKVDIFHFDLLSPGICQKWRVPMGSFGIFPECHFPALPSLGDAWERCDPSYPSPTPVAEPRAQFRLKVFKGIDQQDGTHGVVYGMPQDDQATEVIIADIKSIIDTKVLQFWSRFEYPGEVLRTLQFDRDVTGYDEEGVVDIGETGSHIRLFYLGFAALWLEDYALALSTLRECRSKPRWQPMNIKGDLDTRPILDCIDRGIVRAEEGLKRRHL